MSTVAVRQKVAIFGHWSSEQLTIRRKGHIPLLNVTLAMEEYAPMVQNNPIEPLCPVSTTTLRQKLHDDLDCIADYCETFDGRFLPFIKRLQELQCTLGRLFITLFLLARHLRLQAQQRDYPGYRLISDRASRTLKTVFGEVVYGRAHWSPRAGGNGFHPLDAELGLSRDGFCPLVISLACRLATYLSYAKTTLMVEAFWGWSPWTETVEQWVLGVGKEAAGYMATSPPFTEPDGDILVIEVDGKAVPTATAEELSKRRGSRQQQPKKSCRCKRHRGRCKRCRKGSKKRRRKGDKSKNGRSATLVAIYTLRQGADGQLHGPINKRVWGSFAARKQMMQWARAEATRRGFGPTTDRCIQIVVDGEICLAQRLSRLFPKAIVTLDIRHVEERLWRAGRAYHSEGSPELTTWVAALRKLLYGSGGKAVVARLRELREQIGCRGPGTKTKRAALDGLLKYLRPRLKMMRYARWRQQDLVLASGVIEGAVRYVIGERMDCSGMRWIEGKAEAILHLRCIEVNGLWDIFYQWCHDRWCQRLDNKESVLIRTDQPLNLKDAA
jgi:hypothetical protein